LDDGVKSIVRYYLNNFQVRLAAAAAPRGVSSTVCALPGNWKQAMLPAHIREGVSGLEDTGASKHELMLGCDACVSPVLLLLLQDGHKQDALDLLSGAYKVKKDVKLTFQRQHSPLVPIIIALAALGYALTSATALAGHHTSNSSPGSGGSGNGSRAASKESSIAVLGQHVVAPLLLAAGLLALVGRHGRMLVDRPQLCPQLAHTVAAAESSAAAKQ
jgi:hypothetical protein